MKWLKTFESYTQKTLIIVDVQKSFFKFFKNNPQQLTGAQYLDKLKSYCQQFESVYQIWDNHINGKLVDKDYLYDVDPVQDESDDLYQFPNQVDVIEKRYNYDVDADFYKKVLSQDVYNEIKLKESENSLMKGDIFPTKEGTIITYIGNNHKWFHCPLKLYNMLSSLKDQQVNVVGGADSECLEDVIITAESLGVKIKRDTDFIYSASTMKSM